MDFFSLAHPKQANNDDDQDGATDLFAKAINDRFSNAPLISSHIPTSPPGRRPSMAITLPPVPGPSRPLRLPGQPQHPQQGQQPSPAAAQFTELQPEGLPEFLNDPNTLILDLRPLPTHLTSRIPNALPLSVPSTLLKRPLFSTAKLADMLPNQTARRKFSQWRQARRIVVYDADSNILPEGSNILGLLRKFRTEAASDAPSGDAMERQLLWLKGGFQAVWREQHDLIDFDSAPDQDDEDEDTPSSPPQLPSAGGSQPAVVYRPTSLSLPPAASRPRVLRAGHLPMSAFTLSSTTSQRSGAAHHQQYLGQQAAARDGSSAPDPAATAAAADAAPAEGTAVAYNPFYDTIRQNLELSHGITERIPLKISQIAKDRAAELPFAWLREIGRWAGVDGEGTDVEEEHEEAGPSGSGSGSGRSGSEGTGSGSESGEDSGSGREHGERGPPRVHFPSTEVPHLPPHLHEGPTEDVAEGSEALAMQFYRIELGEQRRLMGVMEHHSRESGGVMVDEGEAKGRKGGKRKSKRASKEVGKGSSRGSHAKDGFPYSITAGVEKGAKNRYRNIWPFEHARVRLQKSRPKTQQKLEDGGKSKDDRSGDGTAPLHPLRLPPASQFLPPVTLSSYGKPLQLPLTTPAETSSDDYVNASYVQPLGTKKRYIATQGPLPETFNDFWTLVWEQNVHVIVMLTREVEGATIKCGNYWSGEAFGPLRLKLVDVSGAVEQGAQGDAVQPRGSFFPIMSKPPEGADVDTIRRVLELTHTGYPHLPPRRVVQLQYLEWPDLNVPDDPRGVLKLIREVEKEVEVSEEARGNWEGLRRPDEWRGRAVLGAVRTSGSGRRSSGEGSPSGTGSSGSISPTLDAVDSDSGIMKHALGERPVLLHCSAGVGRTGGFIAVDAVLDGVRREMRKRREGLRLTGGSGSTSQVGGSESVEDSSGGLTTTTTTTTSATGSGSNSTSEKDASPSSEKANAMEIDASPLTLATLPVVGAKPPMHVAVVGMTAMPSVSPPPMEVDAKASPAPGKPPTLPQRWPSSSLPPSSSSLSPASLSRSRSPETSDSNASLPVRPFSPLAPMDLRARTLSMPIVAALQSSSAPEPDSSPARSAAPSSLFSGGESGWPTELSSLDLPAPKLVMGDKAKARLVSAGKTPAPAKVFPEKALASMSPPQGNEPSPLQNENSPSAGAPLRTDSQGQSPPAFDYTLPRRLHDDRNSPPLLSTLDEPIHRVIEDMREQRMSLCQSLRQYVFVHRAVIEGVLQMVDEERAMYGEAWMDVDPAAVAPEAARAALGLTPALVSEPLPPGAGKGKRGASPTELPKEDAAGDVRLAKRPSIKRRARSSDEESPGRVMAVDTPAVHMP
ncbi:hypothetical protein BV25DRAFT_451974 [Artomyces pyxidatus]|uniref:Uncharacterized protein n=1 Tax=Artomyces pyxidatus TaxID=48021 RepID=A0ACB8T436_9AGAM|nr:hypothetical protein BV25DRAFT_451974 [Artomyces pyxidatus]